MLMAHVDERNELEICAFDDTTNEQLGGDSLATLVNGWIEDNAIDGELHPYLDETLSMLWSLNAAQQRIVECLEADDPHREDMNLLLDTMAKLLQQLMTALED
jgi:hypothetical protein